MDFAKEPQRVLSFCAGYGGIELGLQRAGVDVRTCAYVEIEAFAAYNLVKKIEAGYLPIGPVYTDLKTFPSRQFRGCVDGLVGGYPCQPFSQAGQRKGEQDPRHLWPWIASAIRIIRPRWCIFENVEGHITKGLRNVLSDLGELGFRTTWGIFSAAEVGLPHQRKRVFILANTCGTRSEIGVSRPKQGQERYTKKFNDYSGRSPARPGQPQHWWEPPRVIITTMDRDLNGTTCGMDYAELCGTVDNRTDELRLLGNGVVPATFEKAWRELWTRMI